jgi:hypothetical protein
MNILSFFDRNNSLFLQNIVITGCYCCSRLTKVGMKRKNVLMYFDHQKAPSTGLSFPLQVKLPKPNVSSS